MIVFFAVVLTLIVLVFGISSAMQSYASAQQAQATIETAKAAQMATFGNVLVIVVAVLVLFAVIALVVYALVRHANRPAMNAPRSHTGIWKTSASGSPALQNLQEDQSRFTVQHLTPEQLQELTDDLLDLFEE